MVHTKDLLYIPEGRIGINAFCIWRQVLKLMTEAINGAKQRVILIDGFPRNLDQGKQFEETLKPVEVVLLFDCPEARCSLLLLDSDHYRLSR